MATNYERPPFSDGCPNVCTPEFKAVVALRLRLADGGATILSDHLCPTCGSSWRTAWGVEGIYPEWIPTVQYLAMLEMPVAS